MIIDNFVLLLQQNLTLYKYFKVTIISRIFLLYKNYFVVFKAEKWVCDKLLVGNIKGIKSE